MDDELKEAITKHQVHAGRLGGLSRSEAKREAVRANLAKAREKRWLPKGAGSQSNALGAAEGEKNEQTTIPEPIPQSDGASNLDDLLAAAFKPRREDA